MRIVRLLLPMAFVVVSWPWATQLRAQGLEELRGRLPTFSSNVEGQEAEVYFYYPSLDLMVRMEASAAPDVFSDLEFGYIVGDFYADVSEFLAAAWYQDRDVATIISAAEQLEEEAKVMRQPFEQPGATLAIAMDTEGLSFTYSGRAATGVGEASWSIKVTWGQLAAGQ